MDLTPDEIPAVLIAGTHSGVGKTTVTLGLMAALKERGLKVQPFKVGPDFIDPSHHSAICGRPSLNLDTYMMGIDGVRNAFARGVKGADVAVIEGVMGLYDGLDGTDAASTAEVARALDVPVLLVINVHGASRSAAALELGFKSFDPGVRIEGTLLNRVGSDRHLSMLKSCLKLPVIGAIPRKQEVSLPSRHLGLEMGFESDHNLKALAALIEENSDLDSVLEMRCKVPEFTDQAESPIRARIGVAFDEAFCFYYQENFEGLRRLGADLVFFSPMRDDLPDVDGLYLGGGYPELHIEELENSSARMQIKRASEAGMPIYGECGGLIYLTQEIDQEGIHHKMAGALPAKTIMTKRLQALGYVEAEVVGENPVASVGKRARGHEFHYSRVEIENDARFAYRLRRGKGISDGRDGLVEHSTLGSYLHAHFSTFSVSKFIDLCEEHSRS